MNLRRSRPSGNFMGSSVGENAALPWGEAYHVRYGTLSIGSGFDPSLEGEGREALCCGNVSAHHRQRLRGTDVGGEALINRCARCVAGLT